MYYLTAMGDRSSNSRCQQGHVPTETCRGEASLSLLVSGVFQQFLAYGCITTIPVSVTCQHGYLHVDDFSPPYKGIRDIALRTNPTPVWLPLSQSHLQNPYLQIRPQSQDLGLGLQHRFLKDTTQSMAPGNRKLKPWVTEIPHVSICSYCFAGKSE